MTRLIHKKRPIIKCKVCGQRIYGKYQSKSRRYYICPDCKMTYVVQNGLIVRGYPQKQVINYK